MVGKWEHPAHANGEGAASNRVADFQVVLASANLPNVAPRGNNVHRGDEWIVHPFADLMTECVNITNSRCVENSGIAIRTDRIGLRSRIVRAVVAEDAALAAL